MNQNLIFTILLFFTITTKGQLIVNGDLDGNIGVDVLPINWQLVPLTDVNCQATELYSATPDLTHLNGPDISSGISGNPYHGNTFVSGLHTYNESTNVLYHEGIMQTVSGLNIGSEYKISFYQTVVKQFGVLDTSGSWAIYIDNVLAGISLPSSSQNVYNSSSLIWEYREVLFTASSVEHTIKFLPMDDDPYITTDSILNGALRMGIDSISMMLSTNTSIHELNNLLYIDIYPIPTTKYLNFSGNIEMSELIFFDLSGNLIRQYKLNSNSIDISDLNSGIYIIQLINKKKTIIQRIIKK